MRPEAFLAVVITEPWWMCGYKAIVMGVAVAEWEVDLHADVVAWFEQLCEEDPSSADLVEAAIDLLTRDGPRLGRPMVDRITGSVYHHMKELRPASTGRSEIRILFAFDPRRHAILLVAGDKSGSWDTWYRSNIPVADHRYTEHLAELGEQARRD